MGEEIDMQEQQDGCANDDNKYDCEECHKTYSNQGSLYNQKIISCPLCNNHSVPFDSYPGTFLSCKKLVECQECTLIFASTIPSKKELDQYYSSGLYFICLRNDERVVVKKVVVE